MRRDARAGVCFAVLVITACGGDGKPAAGEAPASSAAASGPFNLTVAAEKCGYEPNASIFDKPAEMWTAQSDRTPESYLNLSVSKLKTGEPIQFNLGVQSGGPDLHEISTVAGGTTKGSGTATVTVHGTGGVIAIEGTDASGAAVKLTVNCARFEPIAEEGGR